MVKSWRHDSSYYSSLLSSYRAKSSCPSSVSKSTKSMLGFSLSTFLKAYFSLWYCLQLEAFELCLSYILMLLRLYRFFPLWENPPCKCKKQVDEPRWRTISSFPTLLFRLLIISLSIPSTLLNGRLEYLIIFSWWKWISEIMKNFILINHFLIYLLKIK